MAPSLKIASLVAAVLLLATAQARGWAPEDDDVDMVPVRTAAGQVVVPLLGGAGTMADTSSLCLQCRCCSKSNPGNCRMDNCTSSFQCDPAPKCYLVQSKCGCK